MVFSIACILPVGVDEIRPDTCTHVYQFSISFKSITTTSSAKDEERWGGIVEEHKCRRSELLNPFKFFGNPLLIIPRMIQVYADTKSFLDYKTIEPYLVAEYVLKG